MKIGIDFPPRFAQRPPQEGGIGGETDSRATGGFEQLLETMRQAMNGLADRAAALAPEIGSHSQAFETARLLVETSLDLPGVEAPAGPNGGRRIAEHRDEITGKVRILLEQLAAHFAPHLQHQSGNDQAGRQTAEPVAAIPASTSERHLAVRLPRVALPLPESPAPQLHAEAAGHFLPAREPANGAAARGSADAPPDTGSGQHSRFAAQLLAAEGGLRVMLRLPRLSENERSDLEARLGQLLESFGHRRREIVIHEIATA